MALAQLHIRRFADGEAPALWQICYTSIHQIASSDYTHAQLQAWVPADVAPQQWRDTIEKNKPLVAELNGQLVAYADVQHNGYIDHFFVAGAYARQGIGSALMQAIQHEAQQTHVRQLHAHVSKNAQEFFQRFGFVVRKYSTKVIGEVSLPYALMYKTLDDKSNNL